MPMTLGSAPRLPELEWKAPAVADLMAIVDYILDDNPDAALDHPRCR